jgi:D-alanyl-D-alanine carboxypeptidase (penicillin-binding protein 5/6)
MIRAPRHLPRRIIPCFLPKRNALTSDVMAKLDLPTASSPAFRRSGFSRDSSRRSSRSRLKPLLHAVLVMFAATAAAAPIPDAPKLKARSYVLMDYDTGQLLASQDPGKQVEPASLTKLMTLYIAFDQIKGGHLKRSDEVLVSEKAWRQGMDSKESRMFIEVGKRVVLEDLLHGIIIQSGNDATVAVAEHIAGTEDAFVSLMNQYARKLGMGHSHYANATGVPDPQLFTSAHDVALLCRALIHDFPEDYALFKLKDFTYNKIHQPNRNLLLNRDPSVDGIKTGHTASAGFSLASSALRENRRLIAVVVGMDSEEARAQGSLALLNYGFHFFETAPLAAAQAPLATIRAWKGTDEELALGLAKPLVVALPRGAKDRVQLKTQVNEPVFAPVAAGQPLGTLTATLDGRVLRSEPLVALKELPEGSLWRRLSDEARLWLKGVTSR